MIMAQEALEHPARELVGDSQENWLTRRVSDRATKKFKL
jgi:phosphodiesterase/alkaline phosphatase D-like protein